PDGIDYIGRAGKYLIRVAVQTTFGEAKAARKKDRVMYAAWQPVIDFDAPGEATLTVEQLEWLKELLGKLLDADEEKKPALPIETSQWLVAMIDYTHDLYERALAAIDTRDKGDVAPEPAAAEPQE